jgi:hypothetical protein
MLLTIDATYNEHILLTIDTTYNDATYNDATYNEHILLTIDATYKEHLVRFENKHPLAPRVVAVEVVAVAVERGHDREEVRPE